MPKLTIYSQNIHKARRLVCTPRYFGNYRNVQVLNIKTLSVGQRVHQFTYLGSILRVQISITRLDSSLTDNLGPYGQLG